jgi:hypothetical protein
VWQQKALLFLNAISVTISVDSKEYNAEILFRVAICETKIVDVFSTSQKNEYDSTQKSENKRRFLARKIDIRNVVSPCSLG